MPEKILSTIRVAVSLTFVALMLFIFGFMSVNSVKQHVAKARMHCEANHLAVADLGGYEKPKCVDPETGMLYDPDFLVVKK